MSQHMSNDRGCLRSTSEGCTVPNHTPTTFMLVYVLPVSNNFRLQDSGFSTQESSRGQCAILHASNGRLLYWIRGRRLPLLFSWIQRQRWLFCHPATEVITSLQNWFLYYRSEYVTTEKCFNGAVFPSRQRDFFTTEVIFSYTSDLFIAETAFVYCRNDFFLKKWFVYDRDTFFTT